MWRPYTAPNGDDVVEGRLLERHQHLGTDVRGTLAGRIKRRWLQEHDIGDAHWAMGLYADALRGAQTCSDHDQIYYHAINVAFLNFIGFEDMHASQEMARLAFEHAGRAERSIWSVATEAEALLYLGDLVTAVAKYKEAAAQRAEPWQLISAGQQAQQIATKLQDTSLQSELQAIFDAKPPISRIFISCSHKDRHWVDELTTMMKPLLKETDQVALWDDSQTQSGSKWLDDIRQALATSRVAVLLVTAEFLASDFISKQELPVILESHKNGKTRIVWVYVSAAPYEVTPLNDLQAANDISKPLEDMTRPEQRQALKTIAFKIKEAVFE